MKAQNRIKLFSVCTQTSLDIKLKAIFSALLKFYQFESESSVINHIDEEGRSAKSFFFM